MMEYCYENGGCHRDESLQYVEFEVIANVTEKATGEVLTGRSQIQVSGVLDYRTSTNNNQVDLGY